VAKTKKASLAPAASILSQNRKALFDYHVLERLEAGVSLLGSEVKAIRAGKISLAESYAAFSGGELFLLGAHIAEYEQAHQRNHDPLRKRKLLLHRRELARLGDAVGKEGLTLVPLSVYLKDGRIKVELGLCKGKQAHDKRHSIKERDQKREMRRALSERG
jgi:SsrA-binding protein